MCKKQNYQLPRPLWSDIDTDSLGEQAVTQDIEVRGIFAGVGSGPSPGQPGVSYLGQPVHDVPLVPEGQPQQHPGQPSGSFQAQASAAGQLGQLDAEVDVRAGQLGQLDAASGSPQPAAQTGPSGQSHEPAQFMAQGRRPDTDFGKPYYFSRSTPPGYKFRIGDLEPTVSVAMVSRGISLKHKSTLNEK